MNAQLPPITAHIDGACQLSGLSRSELYRRMADGSIKAVKNRGRTLIVVDSLRCYLAALPPAQFGVAKVAAAA